MGSSQLTGMGRWGRTDGDVKEFLICASFREAVGGFLPGTGCEVIVHIYAYPVVCPILVATDSFRCIQVFDFEMKNVLGNMQHQKRSGTS